eukprot:CAMPEP_0185769824 /NCGR_PEP_ID=MMETSP1174-20130828/56088_1 /TAXON_ID=35687 /ORGANISM="Dictyocha speculum, Strain CCMP1381" /LENGTH=257 /DNA_ID=CAMNT_0028455035 /DNA_START=36 /DNA_END=809 /DNA_ORIENTATION=-
MEAAASQSIELFSRKEVLAVSLAFYLCSKPIFAAFRDGVGLEKESSLLKAFVFIHNLALCGFSLLVVVKSWPIVFSGFLEHGWVGLHCAPAADFWDATSFGYWSCIFYVSKFYEFVDSWILVLKGKDPSFLQVYHHTGIAIAMYLATQFKCNWLLWVVCLNSFIHTLMYFYYALATLGYKSKYAKALTTMQLTQFMTGIVFSSTVYFSEQGSCGAFETRASCAFIQVYAFGLIYLFKQMYNEKYKSKKASQKAVKKA